MNAWSYTSIPPHEFMQWHLIKPRKNFATFDIYHKHNALKKWQTFHKMQAKTNSF